MKRKKGILNFYITIWIILIYTASLPATVTSAEEMWPTAPEVQSASAIVMEADTGAILYEKDIHSQHYPASITKIMTTLLALENGSMSDVVTFSYDSVHKIEGTHIGMKENEQITLEQSLYAVMLGSANEVAYAVAEHIGGTLDNFVNMMNEKAAALGCTETYFANPHGLPNDSHVTSTHDMALIAQAAYKNSTFRTITRTVSYKIPFTNLTAEERPISNHHSMLKRGPYQYSYCTGGKTGYTNAARNTLVTYAEKNGMTLICVVMQAESEYHYKDTIALLDYGFNNFKKIPVTESDLGLQLSSEGFFPIENNPLSKNNGKIALGSPAQLVLPNQAGLANITSSIQFSGGDSGQIAAVSCTLGEHFLGYVPINYTPGKQEPATEKPKASVQPKEESKPFPVKKAILLLFIALCLLGFLLVILYCIRNGIFEADLSSRNEHEPAKKQKAKHYKMRKSKKAKPTVHKPVGTSKTPRLKSDFEGFDELDDIEDITE